MVPAIGHLYQVFLLPIVIRPVYNMLRPHVLDISAQVKKLICDNGKFKLTFMATLTTAFPILEQFATLFDSCPMGATVFLLQLRGGDCALCPGRTPRYRWRPYQSYIQVK